MRLLARRWAEARAEAQRTPAAPSGVYRRAAVLEEVPTLPSARAEWFAHPDEVPRIPLWRVLVGMLLLEE